MNNAKSELGEPIFFWFIWGSVYILLLLMFLGYLGVIIRNWKSVPVVIRLISVLPISISVVAIRACVRCFLDKDAFVFDHPISCQTSDKGLKIAGIFSKIFLHPNMVSNIYRVSGWTVIEVNIRGRKRLLWFAPWFRNLEQILNLIGRS
jgi:hypothetical protein